MPSETGRICDYFSRTKGRQSYIQQFAMTTSSSSLEEEAGGKGSYNMLRNFCAVWQPGDLVYQAGLPTFSTSTIFKSEREVKVVCTGRSSLSEAKKKLQPHERNR